MNHASLADLLARYPAWLQPLSPPVCLEGGGGWSGATLWRFQAVPGEFVVRAWPPHGPAQSHIEQIHRWLMSTTDLGFVPVPVVDRLGKSLQHWRGVFAEVTPWLSGAPDLSRPPGAAHVSLAFQGMAALHQRLGRDGVERPSAGLRQRHDEINQLVGGGFRSLEDAIRRRVYRGDSHDTLALHWLSLARKLAPLLLGPLGQASSRVIRVQPTVRDTRAEHFLFDGGRLSGLVDFGAMGVDSVAGDLARLIGDWFDGDPECRRQAIASYEQVRPLDPAEADLIEIFEATTALLIGERWVRWHYVENRRFKDPEAVIRGLERGRRQLERLARQMAETRLVY